MAKHFIGQSIIPDGGFTYDVGGVSSHLSSYTSKWNTWVVNGGINQHLVSAGQHIVWPQIEPTQGSTAFTDIKAIMNHFRTQFGKKTYLCLSHHNFDKQNASQYAVPTWGQSNGWQFVVPVKEDTVARVWVTACKNAFIDMVENLVDFFQNGEIATGVNAIDWLHGFSLTNESATGKYVTDPNWSMGNFFSFYMDMMDAARAAGADVPLLIGLNFFSGSNGNGTYFTQLLDKMNQHKIGAMNPDAAVWKSAEGGQHGEIHTYVRNRHGQFSVAYESQWPAFASIAQNWDNAYAAHGYNFSAKPESEAIARSVAKGGHPRDNALLWPEDVVEYHRDYLKCSGHIWFMDGPMRSEIQQAIASFAGDLPAGETPYIDNSDPPPDPPDSSVPTGCNFGGNALTTGGIDFVANVSPSDMKVYTGENPAITIENTTNQELFRTLVTPNYGVTNDHTLVVNIENGTYDVILFGREKFWTSGGQRLFRWDLQGSTVATDIDWYTLGGGKNYAAQVRANGIVVSDTTLTMRWVGNVAATDPKIELAGYAILANSAADPGIVISGSVAGKPTTPQNVQIKSGSVTTSGFTLEFNPSTIQT